MFVSVILAALLSGDCCPDKLEVTRTSTTVTTTTTEIVECESLRGKVCGCGCGRKLRLPNPFRGLHNLLHRGRAVPAACGSCASACG